VHIPAVSYGWTPWKIYFKIPIRREQVGAIGLGAMGEVGSFLLYANAYHELGAVNRPEGDKVVVRVQWLPGRQVSHAKAN
jgi:hypothetical protein